MGQVSVVERKEVDAFVMGVWGDEDDRNLHGLCTYYNMTAVPLQIEGLETSDGDFYPKVVSQIADHKESSEWQTIATAISRTAKVVTITVEPHSASKPLKVDLELFRSFIGKQKYGRLVLKSGEAAVFQIDDLQPPEKMTESSADFVKEKK